MKYGLMWIACLWLLAGAAAAAETSLITNGSMTEGGAEPTGWPALNARVVRDTADFKVGPASLRLEPADGSAEDGKVTQALRNVAGRTVVFSGYVKSTGADVTNAGLALLVQGRDWKQLQWEPIAPASLVQNTSWTEFNKTVTISPEAGNAVLIFFFSGTGKVWLDEVKASPVGSPPPPSELVATFDRGFDFAYGDFAEKIQVADAVSHITAKSGRGGAGLNAQRDLSPFGDESPALRLKVGAGNRAETVQASFVDASGAPFTYVYTLKGLPPDQWQLVLPQAGASLRVPNSGWLPGQPPLDLATIQTVQVQGDGQDAPLDLYLDRMELVKPTPQALEERQKLSAALERTAEAQRQEAERLEREKQEALRNSPHLPDNPAVVGVCAVASDMLCVTIQAQRVQKAAQVPYVAQPGDEVKASGAQVLAWQHGKVEKTGSDLEVFRDVGGGKKERLGYLAVNAGMISPPEKLLGRPLNEATLLEPAAYTISSADDANYRQPLAPVQVARKCKPTDMGVDGNWPMRHWIYLKLPQPLQEGKTYSVGFPGVNTRDAQAAYTHDTRHALTEAIHVTQVGYRPDDPFKRGYLSTWLGTGGALASDEQTFLLLDDKAGQPVYTGKVTLGLAANQPEHLEKLKNYTETNVYYLDFSDFKQPGTYRLCVPGLGVSAPFRIADDVWAGAFTVSMKGLLHQRSGIALGPPFTNYVRPRNMFPGDGVKVYNLDITNWAGDASAVNQAFGRLLGPSLDPSHLTLNPDAWGGYMDAGDWPRGSQHLRATYLNLELLDLFPDYFEKVKLALPPAEATNNLPDVLDEALWDLGLYHRLQRPDGSVGGGVQSTGEPRLGECSWQESLLLGALAPDPETTYRYAAVAAKAARLLAKYDAALAATYKDSALKAWRWGEANGQKIAAENDKNAVTQVMRALAAAELYHLTRDPACNAAFREAVQAAGQPFDAQRDAWFAYAILPDDLADKDLKEKAVAGYRTLGDTALKFSQGNAFNIATDVPGLPMIGPVAYWSTPGMALGPGLPRAHYLTGEAKYLAGAVASCNFSAGANPMNMTMTVGVGRDYPHAPLHVDSRRSGQEPPDGITVYGPFDPALTGAMEDWAHTWVLSRTMTPGSHTWPAQEFYVDVWTWAPMDEFTVEQTIGVTSYTWGYLAARK